MKRSSRNDIPIEKSSTKFPALIQAKYLSLIPKIILGICFIFVLFLSFYKLGVAPFDNWDEAWYAEGTKQMLRTGEFIVLQWNHAAWLDKPPMFLWLAALVSGMVGLSEFSMRFISALSAVIIATMVMVYSYRKYGLVPSLLAVSTLMLNNIFIWRARSGNLDLLATLFIVLSFFLQISKIKYKYPLLGLVFACLYLTKASIVLFPFSIFVLSELLFERQHLKERYKEYLKLLGIFLALPALWLSLGYLKLGTTFPLYYLFKSDQGVASIDFTRFNPDYVNYLYYSLQRRFTYVFLIGVVFAVRYIKDQKNFLLLLYAGALLLQLSFTERSNNWYIIPSIPFWSLLIAYGTYQVITLCKRNILIIIGILLVSSYVSYKTLTVNILPILDTSATIKQTQSSKALNQLTDPTDTVVRLDHLYPVTIYYSDRKVLSSPEGDYASGVNFITRSDLHKAIQLKKLRWVVGVDKDVEQFQSQIAPTKLQLLKVNDEETIGKVL